MSLIKEVAAIIEELGEGTADDVLPEVSRPVTREQVIQALQNAKHTGLLHSDGSRPPVKGSSAARLTTYRLKPKAQEPGRRIASVWDLANDSQRARA